MRKLILMALSIVVISAVPAFAQESGIVEETAVAVVTSLSAAGFAALSAAVKVATDAVRRVSKVIDGALVNVVALVLSLAATFGLNVEASALLGLGDLEDAVAKVVTAIALAGLAGFGADTLRALATYNTDQPGPV